MREKEGNPGSLCEFGEHMGDPGFHVGSVE